MSLTKTDEKVLKNIIAAEAGFLVANGATKTGAAYPVLRLGKLNPVFDAEKGHGMIVIRGPYIEQIMGGHAEGHI